MLMHKQAEGQKRLRILSEQLQFEGSEMVCLVLYVHALTNSKQGLDLTQPSRLMGRRSILREGQLFKTRRSGKELQGILTNDMLILMMPGYIIYRNVRFLLLIRIWLMRTQVLPLEGE